MLPHEPTWATVGLFSAGSVALGAIAATSIITAINRRNNRSSEPEAKRQKLSPPSQDKSTEKQEHELEQQAGQAEGEQQQNAGTAGADSAEDAPTTPDAEASEPHGLPHPDSVVDLQKLQELEQRVADLNALAELGKVYQDSLALSAELRNLGSFRLQQDKVLGRGSLAVVQEGEYAGDSVAVKLLPIGSVFAEDSRKEACLALCLHHPNIVRVVGVHLVEVEAKPYLALVQETAPGGDLGWQIEDCDFHTGRNGSASMDVAIKLLLEAARGLAYMHDVDVVHGDVKSRNLLVFWEDEESSSEDAEDSAAPAAASGAPDAATATDGQVAEPVAATAATADQQQDQEKQRELVWLLKWCDFGVSFRAEEAPDGIKKTVTGTPGFRAPEVMDIGWSKAADTYAFGVIAWQLLTGEKPIVYDREWRMHMPNPNMLRCDRTGGAEEPPRALADLVLDCGAYNAKDRPSMREVVNRLEDIAMQRLQKQQADEAAAAAKAAAVAAEAAAAEQRHQKAAQAAADMKAAAVAAQAHADAAAAKAAADAKAMPPPAAVTAHETCPTCQLPHVRTGHGGLARALSVAAREAAAGGAAADAAAIAHYQQLLQREQREAAAAAAAAAAPGMSSAAKHHLYEVLIQNDDDPITAEAVAHTLDQYESGSLSSFSKVLAGHPQALQQLHQIQEQYGTEAAGLVPIRTSAGSALHHCATAPVHSHLLDTAADIAAAAVAAGSQANAPMTRSRVSSAVPASPVSVVGAVSRSNIELVPAQGPGLVPCSSASAAAAAAAGLPLPTSSSTSTPPAAGTAAVGQPPSSGWYLASGSSFKKGMWLEKGPAVTPGSPSVQHSLPVPPGQAGLRSGTLGASSFAAAANIPMSPLSPANVHGLPDASAVLSSSFSLQLRREQANALPAVAEGDESAHSGSGQTAGATENGDKQQQPPGMAGISALLAGSGTGTGPAAEQHRAGEITAASAAETAAARALRRQQTTRRLGTDVLAAAGALSKALSAFSTASQALPTAAAGSPDGSAAAAAAPAAASPAVLGTNLLLTPDFVAAARGLSEALAALLPSAAALADVAPDQGAAAAQAASEAVAGLKTLQGRMAAAAAAARGSGKDANGGAVTGALQESAFASSDNGTAYTAEDGALGSIAASPAIDIPRSNSKETSNYGLWGTEGASAGSSDRILDATVAARNPIDNNSLCLTNLFGSGSMGSGNMLTRRHSVDGGRPSYAAAPASAAMAVGSHDAAAVGTPVLLRMPSRRQSMELGRSKS